MHLRVVRGAAPTYATCRHVHVLPVLLQRDWRTHWLHLDAAVRHFLAGNRMNCSAPNVWLKMSCNMAVLSVQTTLLAAGSSGSGNVPYTRHHHHHHHHHHQHHIRSMTLQVKNWKSKEVIIFIIVVIVHYLQNIWHATLSDNVIFITDSLLRWQKWTNEINKTYRSNRLLVIGLYVR